jgi:hypothetical protein
VRGAEHPVPARFLRLEQPGVGRVEQLVGGHAVVGKDGDAGADRELGGRLLLRQADPKLRHRLPHRVELVERLVGRRHRQDHHELLPAISRHQVAPPH